MSGVAPRCDTGVLNEPWPGEVYNVAVVVGVHNTDNNDLILAILSYLRHSPLKCLKVSKKNTGLSRGKNIRK